MDTEKITRDEVIANQQHYLFKLMSQDEERSELLFSYGPFLVMNNDISKVIDNVFYEDHPIMKMLMDGASITKVGMNDSLTIGEAKTLITNILQKLPDNNMYADSIQQLAVETLLQIKNVQYKGKLLESAMLDYSPIVPYQAVIVKPGMDQAIPPINNLDLLQQIIHQLEVADVNNTIYDYLDTLLITNLHEILLNTHLIYGIDELQDPNINNNNDDLFIPDGIVTLLQNLISASSSNIIDYAEIYYILSYFVWNFNKIQLNKIGINLNGIVDNINDINHGNRIDVNAAMESFSHIKISNDTSLS